MVPEVSSCLVHTCESNEQFGHLGEHGRMTEQEQERMEPSDMGMRAGRAESKPGDGAGGKVEGSGGLHSPVRRVCSVLALLRAGPCWLSPTTHLLLPS
jgi:hypothetical protein